MLRGRRIVVGVTGGIAAYKTCELVRLCIKAGAEVTVAMTAHATEFVTPLTFETLSRNRAIVDMFERPEERATEHIALARWAEVIIVAPATANILAKAAHGIADDFLSTLILATRAHVLFAPAMNTSMWEAPVTRRNVAILGELGHTVLPTGYGEMAEKETGAGRMLEPPELFDRVVRALPKVGPLAGRRVIVTAGPTPEPLDPVRVLTNRSSGKMGVALAEIAAALGATVDFVHGPLAVPLPPGADAVAVETADEMCRAVLDRLAAADALVMAAAVADFRPADVSAEKIKKAGAERMTLDLVPTVDILTEVARRKTGQFVVGFAVETDVARAAERVRDRMNRKRLDMVVLNVTGGDYSPFGADTNRVTIFYRESEPETLREMAKPEVARAIWDRVARLLPPRAEPSGGPDG